MVVVIVAKGTKEIKVDYEPYEKDTPDALELVSKRVLELWAAVEIIDSPEGKK